MAMGSLARQDEYYDPMSGLPTGGVMPEQPQQAPPDPRFAMGALAHPVRFEPGVGMWPAYKPPKELPDVGEPLIPSGPRWEGNPTANRAADVMGQLAIQSVVPQDPLDAGLMLATGPGRVGYKIAAGALGAVLNPDEAEAGKFKKYSFNNIGVADTLDNLARLNKHVPTKEIIEKQLQPHDIPVGSWLTPLVGDRSRSGELLTHVGEKELYSPVWMQGGYQFMPEWQKQGVAWGSDRSPSTAIGNRVKRLQERGEGDVYGVYTPMTPLSVDASHHMSDTVSQMLRNEKGDIIKDIPKAAVEKFDDKMKALDPDFPGVHSEVLQPYLRDKSMAFRDRFIKTMNTREAREAGFPDVEQARLAVTHPALRDIPNYSGGQSIGKMTGEVEHGSTGFGLAPHYTYRSKLRGEYEGGLPAPLPKELLWRDFMPHLNARDPSAAGKIWLTGLKDEAGRPLMQQRVDRQWQDAAAEYYRRNPMGSVAQP